jgi:hypothetical protein
LAAGWRKTGVLLPETDSRTTFIVHALSTRRCEDGHACRCKAVGTASNESISAIASAFDIPVSALIVRETAMPQSNWLAAVAAKRLWILVALILLVQLLSPPVLSVAILGLWAWAGFEFILLLARRRVPTRP